MQAPMIRGRQESYFFKLVVSVEWIELVDIFTSLCLVVCMTLLDVLCFRQQWICMTCALDNNEIKITDYNCNYYQQQYTTKA